MFSDEFSADVSEKMIVRFRHQKTVLKLTKYRIVPNALNFSFNISIFFERIVLFYIIIESHQQNLHTALQEYWIDLRLRFSV